MANFLPAVTLLLVALQVGAAALSFVKAPRCRRLFTPLALGTALLGLVGAVGGGVLLRRSLILDDALLTLAPESAGLLLSKYSLFLTLSTLFTGVGLAAAAVLLVLGAYRRNPRPLQVLRVLLPCLMVGLWAVGAYYASGSINQMFDLAPFIRAQAVCESGLLLLPLWGVTRVGRPLGL